MLLSEESLLYCAYAIAVFDLLCAVLFAALSLSTVLSHLSWLTIFCMCFGVFWLTLILLLISGIYRRDSDLVWYWILFSCFGILLEFVLIVYAFVSHSTFQSGVIRNSLILCLSLFVETIFAFIIYQFYLAVSQCKTRFGDCQCRTQPSHTTVNIKPLRESCSGYTGAGPGRSSRTSSHCQKCHMLQSRAPTSPYTCGTVHRQEAQF